MGNGNSIFPKPGKRDSLLQGQRRLPGTATGPLVPTCVPGLFNPGIRYPRDLGGKRISFRFPPAEGLCCPCKQIGRIRNKKRAEKGKESPDPLHFLGKERIESRRSLADVLTMDMHSKQFVLVGDPGSGKSTFLRYHALEEMSRKDPCLPVMISLKDVRNSPTEGRQRQWRYPP